MTRAGGLVALGAVGAAACAASLALGARDIPLRDVIDALVTFDGSAHDLIVRDLRVPRTLLALAVGAALGVAGVLMQAVTRNPLADPGIFGVNAGASLGVVIAIFGFGIDDLRVYVWFAIAGAAVAGTIVYALGTAGRGGAAPVKLALAGTVCTAVLASLTTTMLLLDEASLDQFRFWAVGSVAGRGPAVLAQALPFLAAGAVGAIAIARHLDALALGDDIARGLGARLGAVRAAAAGAIVLLVGGAVAAAGPIAFVGLTVPHAARAIAGHDHRWLVVHGAVLGAILVVVADTIGRVVARPGELQAGIITALIGAPFFIALVRCRRLAAL